jgi:hypothetical protein
MSNNIPDVPSRMTGGCMCGAVRYEISERPIFGALCHCNRCRPQSGSAFSTVVFIKRSTIRLEGETTVFEDVGASGMRVGRRCCARCGSPLTTEPDVVPDLMMVKVGLNVSVSAVHIRPYFQLPTSAIAPSCAPISISVRPRQTTTLPGAGSPALAR